MTENYHPTYFTKRAVQNQLLNSIVGNHDLVCSCDAPMTHLAALIFENAQPTNFTEKQKKQIKKCLGIGEEDTATHGDADDDGGISPGDLEKLFAEDTDTG